MRWEGQRESTNIEDRRAEEAEHPSLQTGLRGVGFGLLTSGGGKGVILLALLYLGLSFLGYNPSRFLFGDGALERTQTSALKQEQKTPKIVTKRDHFIATILGQTEDVWTAIFKQNALQYKTPILVRFKGHISSACGYASAASGPFYCPLDNKLYLDDSFFDQMAEQFGAPGEFAQAYVIAHEVGHHVQNFTGILGKVNQQRQWLDKKSSNALSVRIELQADCYAGIWAHYTEQEGLLEEGDIKAALNAAYQIGDDMLERKAQGYIVPDSFTHGTSKQRTEWFEKGYKTGSLEACNSFKGNLNP